MFGQISDTDFLKLIDKHFPKSLRFNKIFNRNTIKVSYSRMQNIKSKISNHNRLLLEKNKKSTADINCNCRNKECCPLDNQCLTTNVIYKAEIKDNVCGDTKEYIGNTAGTFKRRYANHVKSLNIQRYSTETELYKYAWKLKKNKRSYTIKWSIIRRIPAYTAGGNSCNLCLEEKLSILKSNRDKTLNKRSDLFSKCRHRNSFRALNFKGARALNMEMQRVISKPLVYDVILLIVDQNRLRIARKSVKHSVAILF